MTEEQIIQRLLIREHFWEISIHVPASVCMMRYSWRSRTGKAGSQHFMQSRSWHGICRKPYWICQCLWREAERTGFAFLWWIRTGKRLFLLQE